MAPKRQISKVQIQEDDKQADEASEQSNAHEATEPPQTEMSESVQATEITATTSNSTKKRTIIPIDCPSWRNVDVQLKEKLWLDIMETFKVSKKLKKGVLKSASAKWRQFKTNLNRKFVKPNLGQKKKLRKPPNQYAFVGKEAWKKFVAQRITDDWKSLSEQQSNRVRRVRGVGSFVTPSMIFNLLIGKICRITKAELLARDRERDAELEKAKQEMERTRQEMERTREEMVQALKAMGLANIPSPSRHC
ncbi:hypothetical protein POM88_028921 [Heracleum sosnowskyi]|uniref:Transposase n=1 Tax=Heracleum sosnowskyi TaxID=360622 RepID=A0AAD8HTS6_9APIA|nr:hypothetical protein POM88_028921 [Heracleum sosnowskyi]